MIWRRGPAPGLDDAAWEAARAGCPMLAALDEEVGLLRRPLAIRGCTFGFGGSLGFSKVGASWVLLGDTFIVKLRYRFGI